MSALFVSLNVMISVKSEPLRYVINISVKDIFVQELPPPQKSAVYGAQLSSVANIVPSGANTTDLFTDQVPCFSIGEEKGRGGQSTILQQAATVVLANKRGLARMPSGSALRADVVSRCQRQILAIPEGSMVARVIVCVANQNVEDHPGEQLPQYLDNLEIPDILDTNSEILYAPLHDG